MAKNNAISNFIIQSWYNIASAKKDDKDHNATLQTRLDYIWLTIANDFPLDFAKQGVTMAAKDIGSELDYSDNISDEQLYKLIQKEIETLTKK